MYTVRGFSFSDQEGWEMDVFYFMFREVSFERFFRRSPISITKGDIIIVRGLNRVN